MQIEYVVINSTVMDIPRLQEVLNQYGNQGFLLVHLDPVRLVMQRSRPYPHPTIAQEDTSATTPDV